MILAGSADFKTELSQSDMFDPRLQGKIIKLVDVSYGGDFLILLKKNPAENKFLKNGPDMASVRIHFH